MFTQDVGARMIKLLLRRHVLWTNDVFRRQTKIKASRLHVAHASSREWRSEYDVLRLSFDFLAAESHIDKLTISTFVDLVLSGLYSVRNSTVLIVTFVQSNRSQNLNCIVEQNGTSTLTPIIRTSTDLSPGR